MSSVFSNLQKKKQLRFHFLSHCSNFLLTAFILTWLTFLSVHLMCASTVYHVDKPFPCDLWGAFLKLPEHSGVASLCLMQAELQFANEGVGWRLSGADVDSRSLCGYRCSWLPLSLCILGRMKEWRSTQVESSHCLTFAPHPHSTLLLRTPAVGMGCGAQTG